MRSQTTYALFNNGRQISKCHTTMEGAITEAFEVGAVVHHHADFLGDRQYRALANGYEIREITPDNSSALPSAEVARPAS